MIQLLSNESALRRLLMLATCLPAVACATVPLRPRDQGFDTAVWSPGGAVDQGANWFGNDCFDDTFKMNDRWQAFEGYHTAEKRGRRSFLESSGTTFHPTVS